jgi:hypothetical protein
MIISTPAGHIIHKPGRERPYQICKDGRKSSFRTLEAAIEAKNRSLGDSREMAKIVHDANNN